MNVLGALLAVFALASCIAGPRNEFMRANGGFLRYEDLAAHKSEWVEPVSVNYRGYDVWELPPNGQGTRPASTVRHLYGVG